MIFFDTVVKRVTNFPIQSLELNKKSKTDFFSNNQLFKLSILISSRTLYEDASKNKLAKIKNSLSKYFIRAHFNPTPFGVFNSVGILKWGSFTSIKKDKSLNLSVKYDSLFLSSQINVDLENNWLSKKYCLNPSVHFLNVSKISFYKSDIQSGDKIELKYVEIDYDDDLEWLVNKFKKDVKLSEILEEIILDGFEREDVEAYLKDVVDCGLIIEYFLFYAYAEKLSEVNPFLASKLIEKKWHTLNGIDEIEIFSQQYLREQDSLFKLESTGIKYSHAINSFDKEKGTLDLCFQEKIRRFIDFTIQYNSHSSHKNDVINKFIGKISERYNDGFIPINKIFNPYSGLNYTSLVTSQDLKFDKKVLNRILVETEEDIYLDLPVDTNNEIKKNKLPASFSIMVEALICKKSNKQILYIKTLGSNSALNLISRFSDITGDLCQDIVDFEKDVNKNKILADINCLGNFRSLNVSTKKQFYDFAIPINTSFNDDLKPILMSDIFVNLQGGEIRLVSKKHKKQVLPKITSAINPNLSESEIYKFLCDFEYYNQEIYAVNFDFNSYSHFKPYVPRIYLEKDILLSVAQILLVDNDYTLEKFNSYLLERIKRYKFSTLINILDRKGKLVIDTDNEDDIILLYEKVKENKFIYISESLYDFFDPQIIDNDNLNYSHELVISVKNSLYFRDNFTYDNVEEVFSGNGSIPVVSDWLYLELFSNVYSSTDILKYVRKEILCDMSIKLFFFVNFHNPDKCLRLRFKTNSHNKKEDIISKIHELRNTNRISKYHISFYDQEIYRYGGVRLMELAEKIFNLDSVSVLETMVDEELCDDSIKIIAVLKIKNYLEAFNYTLDEMIILCESSINMFLKEFDLTSDLRKSFNKEYSSIKFKIDEYPHSKYLNSESLKSDIQEEFGKYKDSKHNYVSTLIHMSMNRHFMDNQRFNEFKSYYLAKSYLNQIKFKKIT